MFKIEANKIFEPIHKSKCRYIIMKGSAGSGKSVDTALAYIIRLSGEKGRNLLCVRKSEASNRDSTFAELLHAINALGQRSNWSVSRTPLGLTHKNGNRIIFRGVNDGGQREKLKSITFEQGNLTDVWIEEATELAHEDFEIIDDRLRGVLPDGQFYQMKLTFNPVSANHWIKRVFFDREDKNVLTHHSTYLDNCFIDEGYRARMERRRIIDPEGYRIYGLGEWGETGGLILTNYKIQEISTSYDSYDSVRIGQDFGFNHANVVLSVGFKDGDVFILDEIYVHGMDTGEIIKLCDGKQLSKNTIMYCDSAEPDRILMWSRAGYNALPAKKGAGSVKAQIDWLKQRKIYIHPSCTNTINEISGWRWLKDPVSDRYTDEPENINDDAMAALRYAIHDRLKERRARVHSRQRLGGLL